MIRTISLACILFASISVNAGPRGNYTYNVDYTDIRGALTETKADAVTLGNNMMLDISNMSSRELSKSLQYSSHERVDTSSFQITRSGFQVKELYSKNGVNYQPVISVRYEYRAKDND